MKILVTGGTGYIGSHTCVELLNANYEVVIVDNLSNSKKIVVDKIEKITKKSVTFYNVDLLDKHSLENVFYDNKIDAVIHFAGFKAVGESVEIPLSYYHNNVTGTLILCEVMQKFNCKNIVFSSSATVYGNPSSVPISEDFPLQVTNPYGRTKLMIEDIMRDLYASDNSWNICILRYFNPVGSHISGMIGEDPNGIPNNLVPYITQVAIGKLNELSVFGNDYDTPDGTGVRDYIHVVDLSLGHIKALDKLLTSPGVVEYNLGTGVGYSVLEIIKSFEKVTKKKVPYKIVERRSGDIASCYASTLKAKRELDWSAKRGLDDMLEDAWRWQLNNPKGYSD